jgi:transcriptional regulator with XRE-family HTH domain
MGREAKVVTPDLAAIRVRRGLSLTQIARSTRIGVSYLKAIEDGAIEKLPGGIYTKNYIRQYARAIDFDEDDLLVLCGFSCQETAAMAPLPRPFSRFYDAVRHLSQMLRFSRSVSDANRTG